MRSSVDQLVVAEKDGKLSISLRVFDDQPYTPAEKKEYAAMIAERLNRPIESIVLRLTEIPTVSVLDALRQTREEKPAVAAPQTVAELQENLLERVEIALSDFKLPPPARILRKQIVTGSQTPLEIKIIYLSGERFSPENETALLERVRQSLDYEQATINLERIATDIGEIDFDANQAALPLLGMMQLDFAGRMMRENPSLLLSVAASPGNGAREGIVAERLQSIVNYLETRWQIAPAKIKLSEAAPPEGKTVVSFQINEPAAQTGAQSPQ